jgi:hypothetical protein
MHSAATTRARLTILESKQLDAGPPDGSYLFAKSTLLRRLALQGQMRLPGLDVC